MDLRKAFDQIRLELVDFATHCPDHSFRGFKKYVCRIFTAANPLGIAFDLLAVDEKDRKSVV